MTAAPEPAPARRSRRRAVVAATALALAALALILYAAHRILAREALNAWLRSKGVDAAAQVEALSLTDLVGAIRIGDPRHPDFTAERVQVGLGWRGLTPQVRSIRLVRPLLRAQLRAGRFSAGALDPLIETYRKSPPRPGAPQPHVEVRDGRVLLGTDAGLLNVTFDATVDAGRLAALAAHANPTQLQWRGRTADLGPATLSLRSRGDRLGFTVEAPIARAAAGSATLEDAHVVLTAAGPYPDLKARQAAGPVDARLDLVAGRLTSDRAAASGASLTATFSGQASGAGEKLGVSGRLSADLRAAAGGLSTGGLQLAKLTAGAAGAAAYTRGGGTLDLAAQAAGHGAWTALGAPRAGDSADIAAVRRAAAGFGFTASGLDVRLRAGAARVRLTGPVRLRPDRGGEVALAPRGRGYRLTAAGGDLPRIAADATEARLGADGLTARGRIKAGLSLGPVKDGTVDATGRLRIGAAGVAFSGDRCATVSAARLELGSQRALRPAGRLCPAGRPLLTFDRGDWRLAGRVEGLSAEVPLLQAKVAAARGALDLTSRHGTLSAHLAVAAADAEDAAPRPRYEPLRLAGEVTAANRLWRADFAAQDRAGRPLGHALIRHEEASGRGSVQLDTGELRFAPGGLQPAQLSPLAALIATPAAGAARFAGEVAWTPQGATSGGALEVARLDFTSPAGKVAGLSGRIAFSSLAPLIAPPGQKLQAEAVTTSLAPLTDVRAVLGVQPAALRVAEAEAAVGGGRLRVVNLEVPLAPGQPVRGVVALEDVELHDLVDASPFGDRVSLQARVSGRLPFEIVGDKLRVTGGSLYAVEPGRLSIKRTAITGVAASGEVTAPGAPGVADAAAPNAFTDFAYQAMENLAFNTLTAEVQSRPDGRLGVLLHVIGKHDPPQHQEIRLSLFDLIGRKFMNRKLPLPSNTGVDLTLDTTLNLDDLLADYGEMQRLRGSATVQPQGTRK